MINWFLEGFIARDQATRRMALDDFPFTVGRGDDNALIVQSGEVSRRHAQFCATNADLKLEDLGSTNGTFVNRQRITQTTLLKHGDIIRFGNMEYRVIAKADLTQLPTQSDPDETNLSVTPFDQTTVPEGMSRLKEMLDKQLLRPVFQPIVQNDGSLLGYELLGRGAHPLLPELPLELFKLAESAGLEMEISEMFRELGAQVMEAQNRPDLNLFMNTHPAELLDPDRLFRSLRELRFRYPHQKMTIEIHEQAVSDLSAMKKLMMRLRALNYQVAYDDFGAGQSRLIELVDASPDVVKFDISLIRDIDKAPAARVQMLRMLLNMCQEMKIDTLAEGVSRKEEARACAKLQFSLVQGFFFGRPKAMKPSVTEKNDKFIKSM